jgi:hypothetical protein
VKPIRPLSIGKKSRPRGKRPLEFVLLVGANRESLGDAGDTLREAGYLPVVSGSADEAIADMHRVAFDALVVSGPVTAPARERMLGAFRSLRPEGLVIDFDGPARRLVASVRRAAARG